MGVRVARPFELGRYCPALRAVGGDAAGRQFTLELNLGDVWPDLLARLRATIAPGAPPYALQPGSRRAGKMTANHPPAL
jgi:hypothetical protein